MKATGESILNNTNTIKSKSITQSQLGGQDSETAKRLQEALQSKKEINKELNAKVLNLSSEQELQNKKYALISEENGGLREELQRLKRENRQQAEAMEELQS